MLKGNNAETPRYPYAAAAWWDWVSQACRESQERELCSRSRGASLHKRHHVLHVATYSVLEETNGPKLQDFWHCLLRQAARGPPARAHLAAIAWTLPPRQLREQLGGGGQSYQAPNGQTTENWETPRWVQGLLRHLPESTVLTIYQEQHLHALKNCINT